MIHFEENSREEIQESTIELKESKIPSGKISRLYQFGSNFDYLFY